MHILEEQHKLHFWDALLVATMVENHIHTIYTEDAHFRKIPGITVINPFTPSAVRDQINRVS
ncbi:hypothetical protein [Methanocalculus sp.]|uniref:hypothetical protein n=1 Tax=Methanocalculus sp. TaxID=2004547 RepID=UPI00272B924C|nr:hypothetical protein [Methanocalculus sp.]